MSTDLRPLPRPVTSATGAGQPDRPTLRVIEAPSPRIHAITVEAMADIRCGAVRLHLWTGADGIDQPLWVGPDVRHGHASGEDPDARLLSAVESVLHSRERREAAVNDHLAAIDTWLAGTEPSADATLMAEVFGPLTRDQIGFLRACVQRLRGPGANRLRLVLLRHATRSEPPAGDCTGGHRHTDEVLYALHLAGGHVPAAALQSCAAQRGWDHDHVAALTAPRTLHTTQVVTYAGIQQWRRARSAHTRLTAARRGELAAMVTAAQPSPPLPAVAASGDAVTMLAALNRDTCATARTPDVLLAYCRALLAAAARHGWRTVAKSSAYSLFLAAFIAARPRLSAPAAARVLRIAERAGVSSEALSLFAYHLGQTLARAAQAEARQASLGLFSLSRDYVRDPAWRQRSASRIAATFNGEALVRYRDGDHQAAVHAELAGLDALTAPNVPATTALTEQRVLLLTNLAAVHARQPATRTEALHCYRQALHLATETDSLPSLVYVVPPMVRALLAAGKLTEAERVAERLLRRYETDPAPRQRFERAVVGVCCRLAAARLTADDTRAAADWYLDAAQRMRQSAPQALQAMIDTLRVQPGEPVAAALTRMQATLAAQRAVQADLAPLAALPVRR
ncbi:hypothetical protein ABGB16_22205 [Micromonospora sp. B11E3]|uniref:hypothetical protein n=1 Tax=Micromonospora sp. B11E3 TaxID=3153562 RepID=UPI00325E3C1E